MKENYIPTIQRMIEKEKKYRKKLDRRKRFAEFAGILFNSERLIKEIEEYMRASDKRLAHYELRLNSYMKSVQKMEKKLSVRK